MGSKQASYRVARPDIIIATLVIGVMKLFIRKRGVPVSFINYPNQFDIETVIGLHNDNTPISDFAFKGVRYPAELNSLIAKSPVEHVDNGYLFYTFKYQISYQHFMSSTAPLLKEYVENYPAYKLLVPEHYYNALHKELFELFSVANDRIVLLRDGYVYEVANLATRTWDDVAFELTPQRVAMYMGLRERLGVPDRIPKTRQIYIERDKVASDTFNNSNTGKMRSITNEDALIAELKGKGFEIVALGTRTLREKKKLLEGTKTIITPLGANCFNLILSSPERVIFLSNASRLGGVFYTQLVNTFGQSTVSILAFPDVKDSCDPLNQWNSPFEVNIGEVLRGV